MTTLQAVRATRINATDDGGQTVCFAGLADGRSVGINEIEFFILADRLRPFAFHEAAGWVDEVCSVKAVEFEVDGR